MVIIHQFKIIFLCFTATFHDSLETFTTLTLNTETCLYVLSNILRAPLDWINRFINFTWFYFLIETISSFKVVLIQFCSTFDSLFYIFILAPDRSLCTNNYIFKLFRIAKLVRAIKVIKVYGAQSVHTGAHYLGRAGSMLMHRWEHLCNARVQLCIGH